jgi:hypothetical protein
MKTGATIATTAAITTLSIALLSSRCLAGPALDGAGMFVLPAEGPANVESRPMPAGRSGPAPLFAQPLALTHTGRIGPKNVVRFVSQTIERVREVGVAPLFFGLHGLGVTVSGEL